MSSYATPADLRALSVSADALAGIDDPTLQVAIDSASGRADGYLRSRYTLPITNVSDDLKQVVCDMAAYIALKVRGFNPEGNELLVKGWDDALKWLQQVASGLVSPALGDSSGGTPVPSAPVVISNCRRGW